MRRSSTCRTSTCYLLIGSLSTKHKNVLIGVGRPGLQDGTVPPTQGSHTIVVIKINRPVDAPLMTPIPCGLKCALARRYSLRLSQTLFQVIQQSEKDIMSNLTAQPDMHMARGNSPHDVYVFVACRYESVVIDHI